MVKLLSAIVMKHNNGHPVTLYSCFELASFGFFSRGSIQEVCQFVSRETITRTSPGQTNAVSHATYICHTRVLSSGLAAAVVVDQDYPSFVAQSFLNKALVAFQDKYPEAEWRKVTQESNLGVPDLNALLQEYQDPSKADKILQIKKELEDTKEVVIKSIDQLLERGEKLDDLVERSQDLSFQSKAFANKAEDLNSCCTIL
eukprot:TRINITY_DN17090_c0_g1_i1.p1 TRINITY_DN17090_c0_g1~~TRINITY_DN17090_c0_g1_i1.p1  ORF type:complete len:201 (-),score=48.85 TRINITY_DN17090_c0_g1_i1:49-651(-)